MRRRLSQGIRIYITEGRTVMRDSYNFEQGMKELKACLSMPTLELIGTGSESGAMAAYFKAVA